MGSRDFAVVESVRVSPNDVYKFDSLTPTLAAMSSNSRVWGPSAVKADGRFQKPSQQSAAAQLRAQRAQKTAPQKKAPSRRVATSPLRFPSDPESRQTSPVRRSESGE